MNKLIGISILTLYFTNFYICELIFKNDITKWWYLNRSILLILVILSIRYKRQNNFIEKLFSSIIVQNIYMLLVRNETTYTLNDLWFLAIFTAAQYIKTDKSND